MNGELQMNMKYTDKWALEGLTSCAEILYVLYTDINTSTNLMVINMYLVIIVY